ncbi:uncharacterized protein LOC126978201 isoform X3 [Leptidea sinapis]|uniref:uncharacterized protein LOC126978201 isoform X3 n=1 Tax=Leptidea sinapis TaxID=189913 RepID=UPI0021410828|nr:uncharacterized protein LOC126978201 isoform X3 [Leptidea sinapis]
MNRLVSRRTSGRSPISLISLSSHMGWLYVVVVCLHLKIVSSTCDAKCSGSNCTSGMADDHRCYAHILYPDISWCKEDTCESQCGGDKCVSTCTGIMCKSKCTGLSCTSLCDGDECQKFVLLW